MFPKVLAPPVVYVERYILNEMSTHDKKTPGNVLNMMYLLPNLSIYKIDIPEPTALTKAKGIFKIISTLSCVYPSTVIPVA